MTIASDSEPEDPYRRGMRLLGLLEKFGGGEAGPVGVDEVPGYRIQPGSLLGEGQFGRVYLARDVTLDRLVAIKILRDAHDGDSVQRGRMEIDALALAKLQQSPAADGVVPIFESGRTRENRSYLIMQYVEGGSLAARLRDNPLQTPQPIDPKAAATWIEPVARTLHVAHQAGIVHRDMKPQNILITREGKPKVCDFGLARLPDAPGYTADREVLGTPEYMSPEQARCRDEEVGPATDIHALGATLYECLTGRAPYKGANPMQTLDQLATTDPIKPEDLVPSVPRDLATICLKCLNKAPGDRYASALELAEDLRRYLDDRPILARRAGRLERLAKWRRRDPGAFRWAVLTVASLLLGTAFSLAFAFYANARAVEARAEKRRAEGNAAIRLRALDDVVRTIAGPQLQLAGQTRLMNHILEQLLPRFEEVVKLEGRDAPTLEQQATTWNSLSVIRSALGQGDRALAAARRAEAIFRELAATPRANPTARLGLASALDYQGSLLGKGGKFEEGIALLGEASAILDALPPSVVDEKIRIGRTAHVHNNWASCLMRLGERLKRPDLRDEAATHYHLAIRHFERAARDYPEDPSNLDWQARTTSNLALLEVDRNHPAEGLALAVDSVKLARKLVVLAPDALDTRECLGTCLTNEGEIRLKQGGMAAALPLFRQALSSYQSLLDQVPNSREFRWCVAMTESNIGASLGSDSPEERADAIRHLERAAAIYRELLANDKTNRDLIDYANLNAGRLKALQAQPR